MNHFLKPGGVAENIIEDSEAGVQMRAVRLHLKDVVLKNVNLNYVGKEFRKNTLTKTRFKFFHSGSSVIVAGKYDPVSLADGCYTTELSSRDCSSAVELTHNCQEVVDSNFLCAGKLISFPTFPLLCSALNWVPRGVTSLLVI